MNENELNIDPQIQANAEEKIKQKNRFEQLSEKVIITSKEKEAEIEARKKAEADRDFVSKERDFYKDFSVNVSKYPAASQYQDQILEKVRKGYTTADAMVSVLATEGKLNSTADVSRQTGDIAGGSAPTSFEGTKSLNEMTPSEKMAALTELDKTGDLASALRGGL